MGNQKNKRILAYGFDEAGFILPEARFLAKDTIHYARYGENVNFEDYDGVIIPQGIFEKFKKINGYDGSYCVPSVDKDILLDRERSTLNALRGKTWICFLVGAIVDEIQSSAGGRQKTDSSDLCKIILNDIGITDRKIINATPNVDCYANEFIKYHESFGVAKTGFSIISDQFTITKECKVLVSFNHRYCSGFEWRRQRFFLPFHTTTLSKENLEKLIQLVADSIIAYKIKHDKVVPEWLGSFQFSKEAELENKIETLLRETEQLDIELRTWKDYKTILSTSGDHLKETTVSILSQFFDLEIDPLDEGKEDAKIIEEKSAIALIEIKGTNKGIKREHINQVDSHRERNGLNDTTPGILLINNEMDIESVENKLGTSVAKEHVVHAKNLNILIVRTVDLLFFMKLWENVDKETRKRDFLSYIRSGGGWLKWDLSTNGIVKE